MSVAGSSLNGLPSDVRVAFDVGHGPIVLFCHGVATSAEYWRPLVDLLPDLRCLGLEFEWTDENADDLLESRALAVADFVLELDVPVSLVGHSLGGAIATMAVGVLGETVTHLILEAPGGLGPELNPFAIVASRRSGIAMSRVLYSRPLRRYVERRETTMPIELRRLYRQLDSTDARRRLSLELRAARRYQRDVDASALLRAAASTARLLILWGERDLVLPVFQARRATAALPSAELFVVPGAGHTPHVSHPEVVASVIAAFLRDVPSGPLGP